MLQPLFYFPSTIISVDDNQATLEVISELFEKKYTVHTFSDPNKAMDYLKQYQSPLSNISFLRAVTDHDNIDQPEYCQTDLNLLEIAKLAKYAERSKEIGILIIDFDMLGINGLEFCRALKDLPIKKILLTGKSSYKEAVSAFNERIINAFIRKDSLSVINELEDAVKNLTQQYFFDRSQALLANLESEEKSSLSDEKFNAFFENWRNDNHINEYYLIDRHGSFLCVNAVGESFYFIVQTEQTINEFLKYNDIEISDVFPDLIQSIKQRKKIPFFGLGKTHCDVEISNWNNCFFPAESFDGNKRYYWTVIK